MESILASPLFTRLPTWIKKFLRRLVKLNVVKGDALTQSVFDRKLLGLEGRYRNICEIEPDSYDDKKLLPNFVSKTIKDKCNE